MSTVLAAPSLDLPLSAPCTSCRAIVVVPARNEASGIEATLDALRLQVDLKGRLLDYECYEVLLLLNNCTDDTATIARRYACTYDDFHLHIMECELAPEDAHVGTARKRLMDWACDRLESLDSKGGAILSTDADTVVAVNWIAANLSAIAAGAEVVGGVIDLLPDDLEKLEPGLRLAYDRDRAYQALVAELESMLDPDPADPWPRHLHHFGASLACTPEIYRRSGGLPAVKPLEDVAFVDALRKVGAKIRHAPEVRIFTSARLDGRAEIGLSGQLRHWQDEAGRRLPHMVDSAEWLGYRFSEIAHLRRFSKMEPREQQHHVAHYPQHWRDRLLQVGADGLSVPRFLEALDCNALIEETFRELAGSPKRHNEINLVLLELQKMIDDAKTTQDRK